MTGDTYGAVNELAEVTVLLSGIILFGFVPELYHPPSVVDGRHLGSNR